MPRLIDRGERRREIAHAAWRVIVRDGIGRASVRGVAAEAGVSAGSLRHVFASQRELLLFALEMVAERFRERSTAPRPPGAARESVAAAARGMLPLDEERRAESEAYLALCDVARTDATLRGPRDAAHLARRRTCRRLVGELDNGVDLAPGADLDLEAARLHALLDGLAAHLLREPADADQGWATAVLARHLDSLAAQRPAGKTA
ncbi:TetR/AcrR family transcriptional regulator [Streptomyces millisiae]|uniref:TetR family transcriptional regulator C-terminal domain-containing protein n=1 Tax=Streptomyces millisiae TaxID=3075542 RepID=A0ABU2LQF8_9ACTN|nr:TetR family transcriptional regulator C-terminal domain-containing protein [Streptomyces sp. DSM 44918]MDT0319830.1 TetR family transcriptional regulator C-terminal domain-containing protein [Streptomyces sp. DSM 44918]